MELIEVILSKENLNRAYKKVVANKGASGVDGVTVEELGDYIRENREKIVTSLRNRTYIPKPVRRVYIPKDNGKKRPLGIPTALDRTIQQAIAQPISDIYEEIFSDYSYGFRAGRSCHDAIRQALEYLNDGYEWVVDIDIEQFFDKVNHDKLIQILREQVNDSTTLNLIRKYLKAGVMENGLEKATITGVPQGSVISPLLTNIYLNTLDRLWEKYGLTHGILVRYADDTVIICKNKKSVNHALNLLQYIMTKLDLKLHPVKTKIVNMWDGREGFDFLGLHHRRMTTETSKGQLYKETYQYPSRKAMKKMKAEVKRNVNRRSLLVAKEEDLIKNLNPKITGWKNYYSTKRNKKWMQALDWYIICTFTRWYNKKHQRRNRMSKVGFVRNSIYEKGLKKMARA